MGRQPNRTRKDSAPGGEGKGRRASCASRRSRAHGRPRRQPAAHDTTDTETTRSRGRSSKSTSTTCCQVPRPSSPRRTGTDSDGPITAARRCACAFVSSLRTLCSYAPWAGISRSSSACRSATPPGSYSIVVTATVEPTANTTATPVSTPERPTIDRTPSVRSTIAPLPGVLSRSSPACTAIASGPDPEPPELALAALEHRAVQAVGVEVEPVGRQRLAVQLDAALGEPAPHVRARHAQALGEELRQVLGLGADLELRHLVRRLAAHVDAIEVLLRRPCRLGPVEALDDRARERPLRVTRRRPGRRLLDREDLEPLVHRLVGQRQRAPIDFLRRLGDPDVV